MRNNDIYRRNIGAKDDLVRAQDGETSHVFNSTVSTRDVREYKLTRVYLKRLTMAPNVAIWRDPRARVVVHTISIAKGIEATIRTTVKLSVSVRLMLLTYHMHTELLRRPDVNNNYFLRHTL